MAKYHRYRGPLLFMTQITYQALCLQSLLFQTPAFLNQILGFGNLHDSGVIGFYQGFGFCVDWVCGKVK